MTECIGIVTGGGDCPGLNAVIRAVVKAASRRGWEAIGILGGYESVWKVDCRKVRGQKHGRGRFVRWGVRIKLPGEEMVPSYPAAGSEA